VIGCLEHLPKCPLAQPLGAGVDQRAAILEGFDLDQDRGIFPAHGMEIHFSGHRSLLVFHLPGSQRGYDGAAWLAGQVSILFLHVKRFIVNSRLKLWDYRTTTAPVPG